MSPGPQGGSALDVVATALGRRAKRNEPLGARTTYRVGGAAAVLVDAQGEDDLVRVHEAIAAAGAAVPVLVLGRGSNLLVADAGFDGVVVAVGRGFDWKQIDDTTVRAGAARPLPVVARDSARAGLRGLEWGVGVPGSVGGALRMNAGGHGSDVAAVLSSGRLFDLAAGEGRVVEAGQLALGYRRSAIGPGEVVVWGEFALARGERAEAEEALADVVRWRKDHQPGGSNAGSVFTNPPEDSAGRLVEAAGLKGFRLGSAQVSPKHANFIQADSDGSADDVRRLIDHVRSVVEERTGVTLEPEVRLVGFSARVPGAVSARRVPGPGEGSTSTGGRDR